MDGSPVQEILMLAASKKERMVHLLEQLVYMESPSTEPEAFPRLFELIASQLRRRKYSVKLYPGTTTAGYLVAHPRKFEVGKPAQLMLGHCDTVWPIGTIGFMPFLIEENTIRGPGVFDMKGGLTQMLVALEILTELELQPDLAPVILINSDEEIGSVDSGAAIENWARQVERVFVMEPSLGIEGRLKTARKGVSQFKIDIKGKAAHAGLDPEKGVSAIRELTSVIDRLYALNSQDKGISINVGVIQGGIRPNVIAPSSSAEIDVRVMTFSDSLSIESAILGLEPTTPGITYSIERQHGKPPMERTIANQRLWQKAYEAGQKIGLQLGEGTAGGGSDGNTTSQYTATLDGLGAVGDGAHATHEYIFLDKMIERTALLTLLFLSPGT